MCWVLVEQYLAVANSEPWSTSRQLEAAERLLRACDGQYDTRFFSVHDFELAVLIFHTTDHAVLE